MTHASLMVGDTITGVWYDSGMTRYEKIAISIPSRAAENARRAVRDGRAPSVSAYVTAALDEKASREDLRAMFREMLAETGGPPTPAERRWLDRVMGPKKRKRRRNKR
jgi:hypothetical protein